jgi:transketolase
MTEMVWEVVHRLAREDSRVIFVGSDLNPTILAEMRTELPEQFMMEGIAEQHLIGMVAGMALEGARPVFSTISTFLTRRCFEQLHVDIGLHRLPVVLLGTGPGVAYHFFGPTHTAVDDFALLRTIPGVTLISPKTMAEASILLEEAIRSGLFAYIRVPRPETDPLVGPIPHIGRPLWMRPGEDIAVLSTGALTHNAIAAAETVDREGISARVVHLHTIKPLDPRVVLDAVADVDTVITVEEHLRDGGLGSAVLEILADSTEMRRVIRLGLPDRYVSGYGTWVDAIAAAGLDAPSLATVFRNAVEKVGVR